MVLGVGSNNVVEIMSLKLLLQFVVEKEIHSIQIFGDSMNVINWTGKTQICHNTFLLPILEEIYIFFYSFETIYTLSHVYREHNQLVKSLSKDRLQLLFGSRNIT
jgi:hypothetical protein